MKHALWVLAIVMTSLVQEPDGSWRQPYADPGIDGPGTFCPWPFDPAQLVGQPIGQYHCPYCGSMVVAGIGHLDYTD
jgi:hypothetical protein